jgi:hypothetical protein
MAKENQKKKKLLRKTNINAPLISFDLMHVDNSYAIRVI